jgi:hypothetical protein
MGKVWTDEEKDLIRKYKGARSNKQIAKMLGCTVHQLTYAMRKFNIKRTWYEYISLYEKWGGNRKGGRFFGGRPQNSAAKKPVHFRGLDYPRDPMFKRPFTNKEDAFIEASMSRMSPEEIAARLKRPVTEIQAYISLIAGLNKMKEKKRSVYEIS